MTTVQTNTYFSNCYMEQMYVTWKYIMFYGVFFDKFDFAQWI